MFEPKFVSLRCGLGRGSVKTGTCDVGEIIGWVDSVIEACARCLLGCCLLLSCNSVEGQRVEGCDDGQREPSCSFERSESFGGSNGGGGSCC